MQSNPQHMGPTFEYISRRDHELHLQKMREILRKPLPKASQSKPRKVLVSRR